MSHVHGYAEGNPSATTGHPLGLLQLHARCHRGDGRRAEQSPQGWEWVRSAAKGAAEAGPDGKGFSEGYGRSGGQGQGVPRVGSCPLCGHGHPNYLPHFVHTKGSSMQAHGVPAARGTFPHPLCSLPGAARHETQPSSRCCSETLLAGASVTLSATDQVGAKPSETASGIGLTFTRFCMKYQFSIPFI